MNESCENNFMPQYMQMLAGLLNTHLHISYLNDIPYFHLIRMLHMYPFKYLSDSTYFLLLLTTGYNLLF